MRRRRVIAAGRVPNKRERAAELSIVREALSAAQTSKTVAPEVS